MTSVQEYNHDGAFIRVSHADETAKIQWHGVWEFPEPELSIGPFLKEVMPRLSGKKVIVDFSACDYMNSSTINTLFQLVKELNARHLDTELRYDAGMEWQRITFRSVKTITQTLPHIRVVAN